MACDQVSGRSDIEKLAVGDDDALSAYGSLGEQQIVGQQQEFARVEVGAREVVLGSGGGREAHGGSAEKVGNQWHDGFSWTAASRCGSAWALSRLRPGRWRCSNIALTTTAVSAPIARPLPSTIWSVPGKR